MARLSILFLLGLTSSSLIILSSCGADNPIEPQEQWPAGAGAVLFVKPDDAVTKVPYGKMDTLRWRVCPDSVVNLILIQVQEKDKDWEPLFHVPAAPNFTTYKVLFEIGTEIRFRIKNAIANDWDSTQYITVIDGMRLVFPGKDAVLYSGLTVKIRYRNPGDRPFTLYYTRDDRKEQWTRLMSSSDPMFWSIADSLVSGKRYYMKMVDDLDGRSRVSDGFMIEQGPDPGFHIIAPDSTDKYFSGQELEVAYVSDRGVVAFDLSTDGGKVWKEIIPGGTDPKWTVTAGKLIPDCYLRMRTTDTSFSVTSQPFTLDPHKLLFRIIKPKEGDIVLPGDYITIEHENSVGDTVFFYLSSDNGRSWDLLGTQPLKIPSNYRQQPLRWFVDQDPAYEYRLKMATRDERYVFVTGPIHIDDDLADFFPISQGKDFTYSHWSGQSGPQQNTMTKTIRTISLVNVTSTADAREYECRITDRSRNGDTIRVFTAKMVEELHGLHRIHAPFSPFSATFSRYYSAKLRTAHKGEDYFYESYWMDLESGVGLIKLGHQRRVGMYQYDQDKWELWR
ncbi:MAG: hypothetical protein GXO82_01635 [Chlorobi bacterium]|nr:hypothetical protein [Chlorobiota bacterium]